MNNIHTKNITVRTEPVGDKNNKIKIIVDTDEKVNGVADTYISYKVKKNNLFVINSSLHVGNINQNGISDFYLRSENSEYIPINIVNGHGEVLLTSIPKQDSTLELYEYKCERILKAFNEGLYVTKIEKSNDSEYSFGIYNPDIQINMENKNTIIYNNNRYVIKKIQSDADYTYITVKSKDDLSKIDLKRQENYIYVE